MDETSLSDKYPDHIAIVGGGRWARVLADVVCDVAPDYLEVSLCSPGNAESWVEWLVSRDRKEARKFSIVTYEALLEAGSVEHVLIARDPSHHAATATDFLKLGKKVFVEKPFALNVREAETVVAADEKNVCNTGLVFLFHPGLREFTSALSQIGDLEELRIAWNDPRDEIRHGEYKVHNVGLNCVLDVFPHIWSILRQVDSHSPIEYLDVDLSMDGQETRIQLAFGNKRVFVEISRYHERRERLVSARGSSGSATVDFATVPGRLLLDGRELSFSESEPMGPLARQLSSVLTGKLDRSISNICGVAFALESIKIAELILGHIRRLQYDQIEQAVATYPNVANRQSVEFAIREIISSFDSENHRQYYNGLHSNDDGLIGSDMVDATIQWLAGRAAGDGVPEFIREDAGLNKLRKRLLVNRTD